MWGDDVSRDVVVMESVRFVEKCWFDVGERAKEGLE